METISGNTADTFCSSQSPSNAGPETMQQKRTVSRQGGYKIWQEFFRKIPSIIIRFALKIKQWICKSNWCTLIYVNFYQTKKRQYWQCRLHQKGLYFGRHKSCHNRIKAIMKSYLKFLFNSTHFGYRKRSLEACT